MVHGNLAVSMASQAGLWSEWFLDHDERRLWDCICSVVLSGKVVCRESVIQAARDMHVVLDSGLLDDVCNAKDCRIDEVEAYLAEMREEYVAVGLHEITERVRNKKGKVAALDIAGEAITELQALISRLGREVSISEIADDVISDWEAIRTQGKQPGLPMPWETLYSRCGSIEPGQVCVVAGHGAAGKSSLVLEWALHLVLNRIPVLFFTLEDTTKVLVRRAAIMLADVSAHQMRLGLATEEEYRRAAEAAKSIVDMPLHIVGHVRSARDIVVTTLRHSGNDIGAIFVDAFKDIRRDGASGNEGDNETMATLTGLAADTNVPLVVTHHVRKPPTSVKSDPLLVWHVDPADLRGSARIWDDARMVIILQKYPAANSLFVDDYTYYLHVAKSNHGYAGYRQKIIRTPSLRWREEHERG